MKKKRKIITQLKAQHGIFNRYSKTLMLTGNIQANFISYQKKKRKIFHTRADKLNFDQKIKQGYLEKNIRIRSKNTLLTTDHLNFSLAAQNFSTSSGFFIKTSDGTLQGPNLVFNYKQNEKRSDWHRKIH